MKILIISLFFYIFTGISLLYCSQNNLNSLNNNNHQQSEIVYNLEIVGNQKNTIIQISKLLCDMSDFLKMNSDFLQKNAEMDTDNSQIQTLTIDRPELRVIPSQSLKSFFKHLEELAAKNFNDKVKLCYQINDRINQGIISYKTALEYYNLIDFLNTSINDHPTTPNTFSMTAHLLNTLQSTPVNVNEDLINGLLEQFSFKNKNLIETLYPKIEDIFAGFMLSSQCINEFDKIIPKQILQPYLFQKNYTKEKFVQHDQTIPLKEENAIYAKIPHYDKYYYKVDNQQTLKSFDFLVKTDTAIDCYSFNKGHRLSHVSFAKRGSYKNIIINYHDITIIPRSLNNNIIAEISINYDQSSVLRVKNSLTGECIVDEKLDDRGVESLYLSADGNYIIYSCASNFINQSNDFKIVDLSSGAVVAVLPHNSYGHYCIRYQGKTIILYAQDDSVVEYCLEDKCSSIIYKCSDKTMRVCSFNIDKSGKLIIELIYSPLIKSILTGNIYTNGVKTTIDYDKLRALKNKITTLMPSFKFSELHALQEIIAHNYFDDKSKRAEYLKQFVTSFTLYNAQSVLEDSIN